MTHPFDSCIALASDGPGRWTGRSGTDYGNLVGAFGGTVSATLLNAVMLDDRRHGHPVSLTVNFCAALGEAPFTIVTKLQRGGKYTQHWSLELTQDDTVKATATLVCAIRNETFSHQPAALPPVPAPQELTPLPSKSFSNWISRYDFRFVEGGLQFGKPNADLASARTVAWVRDDPPRPLDHASLAALSDSFFLRLLHVRGTMEPMGTVTLTTHFLATPEELTAQHNKPVLAIADANRFHHNFHDQHMQILGTDGTLLATGSQLVWYRQ